MDLTLTVRSDANTMKYQLTPDDIQFRSDFEAAVLAPGTFDHRGHVRLAYVYLTVNDDEQALSLLRAALLNFLSHYGIDDSKYHETITHAWLLAVRHFMEISAGARSSNDFIEQNTVLLDPQIMLSHYSADLLFSKEARAQFVEPDLEPIPRHLH